MAGAGPEPHDGRDPRVERHLFVPEREKVFDHQPGDPHRGRPLPTLTHSPRRVAGESDRASDESEQERERPFAMSVWYPAHVRLWPVARTIISRSMPAFAPLPSTATSTTSVPRRGAAPPSVGRLS